MDEPDNGTPAPVDDIQSNAHLAKEQDTPEPKEQEAQPSEEGDQKEKVRNRPPKDQREKFRLEQRIAELEAQVKAPNNGTPKTDSEPKLEDFDDAIEYVKAHNKWSATEALNGYKAELEQKAQEAEFQKTVAAYEDRANVFTEKTPDYLEKVEAMVEDGLATGLVNDAMQKAVLKSELAPEIAYYLATDPDGPSDLMQLNMRSGNPALLNQAIKLLESHVKNLSAPAVKKTNAPQPISPVKGGSKSEKSLDEMPYDEFVKARESQLRR